MKDPGGVALWIREIGKTFPRGIETCGAFNAFHGGNLILQKCGDY